MKILLCLTLLAASVVRAEEVADRISIETTVAVLNTPTPAANIFAVDFPNAVELQSFLKETTPIVIATQAGTVIISREPMGEATWYSSLAAATAPRFVTRSVTFLSPDLAVIVATREFGTADAQSIPVLFVLKRVATDWRIASFRVLDEAQK